MSAQLVGGLLPQPVMPPSPFELAAEGESAIRVERAMTSLSPPYREILMLCAVEGMSPKEAAEVLGISGELAHQRLARARAMIEDALGDLARYAGGTP